MDASRAISSQCWQIVDKVIAKGPVSQQKFPQDQACCGWIWEPLKPALSISRYFETPGGQKSQDVEVEVRSKPETSSPATSQGSQ